MGFSLWYLPAYACTTWQISAGARPDKPPDGGIPFRARRFSEPALSASGRLSPPTIGPVPTPNFRSMRPDAPIPFLARLLGFIQCHARR